MAKRDGERQTGWRPMPTILKVIFIILIIGIVFSLISLVSVSTNGYSFLGFYVLGLNALGLMFLFNIVGSGLILLAFWKRYSWAGTYSMIYYLFFIVNGLLSISNIPKIIQTVLASQVAQYGAEYATFVYAGAIIGIIFGVIVNAVFLMLIYIKRDYFH